MYAIWIFGTFGTSQGQSRDSDSCDSVIADLAQYEILISSLSYVACMFIYAGSFLMHRTSRGKLPITVRPIGRKQDQTFVPSVAKRSEAKRIHLA